MQAIFGVIYHFLGGFASGSFYIPYRKVQGWSWESYWIVGGVVSWLIVPPLAAFLTIPNFADIISGASTDVLMPTYIFGVLWGIGGLTYGLGVRYLGVSLGSSVILGLCSVFGAIIPSVYYDIYPKEGKDTLSGMASAPWGQLVLLGLLICVIGIIVCGKAGVMKERDLSLRKQEKNQLPSVGKSLDDYQNDAADSNPNNEFKIGLGLFVSIISGLLSACFAFGIDAGKDMADLANETWKAVNPKQGEFLYQNNVTYVVILWGGFTTNFIWCMILNFRNKTFGDYTNNKTPLLKNYFFSALAGTTWFIQFFFYGMGESRLGNGASSWILHMAFIILIANAWGLLLNEWRGISRKTFLTILSGISLIILSILIVGYGNSLK